MCGSNSRRSIATDGKKNLNVTCGIALPSLMAAGKKFVPLRLPLLTAVPTKNQLGYWAKIRLARWLHR